MKCRVHGYKHHTNCKYCNSPELWVNDNYKPTKKDKELKWKKKFKTKIVHKARATKEGIYYYCNRAVGKLSKEQLLYKTNWKGKKITCKNCRKFNPNKKKKSKENVISNRI